MTKEDKIHLLDRLLWADGFSNTLKKYSVRIVPLEDTQKNWHSNSGDVKYHIGTSFTRKYPNGKKMTVIGY